MKKLHGMGTLVMLACGTVKNYLKVAVIKIMFFKLKGVAFSWVAGVESRVKPLHALGR